MVCIGITCMVSTTVMTSAKEQVQQEVPMYSQENKNELGGNRVIVAPDLEDAETKKEESIETEDVEKEATQSKTSEEVAPDETSDVTPEVVLEAIPEAAQGTVSETQKQEVVTQEGQAEVTTMADTAVGVPEWKVVDGKLCLYTGGRPAKSLKEAGIKLNDGKLWANYCKLGANGEYTGWNYMDTEDCGGKWYENGQLHTDKGWKIIKNFTTNKMEKFYFDYSGIKEVGKNYIQQEGSSQYYEYVFLDKKSKVSEAGRLLSNEWYIDYIGTQGKKYWAYADKDGKIFKGWLKEKNKWYYLGVGGWMYDDGMNLIDGKYYYFNTNGCMLTGWVKVSNAWYYMNNSGVGKEGWVKVSGKWYYLGFRGRMQEGLIRIGKTKYYLTPNSGAMKTGWFKVRNYWYYANGSGALLEEQWLKDKGSWYYLGYGGSMNYGGWDYIKGKWYYFYNNGKMAANTYIGSSYLNSSGVWVR